MSLERYFTLSCTEQYVVTLERQPGGLLDIRRDDGVVVGYLTCSENVLVKAEVYEKYRGEGYATAAIEEWCRVKQSEGVTRLETTVVVSAAFARVLEKNGFTPVERGNKAKWEINLAETSIH